MNISNKLGLKDDGFCRMVTTTKMLFSNVIGHAAEFHYEKYLKSRGISYTKAPTDVHYDYTVDKNSRDQVKRWETDSTNGKYLGVNLTTTHGNRLGPDAFYKRDAFDNLILFDVGFKNHKKIKSDDIPINTKYSDRLPGKFKILRENETNFSNFDNDFLLSLKRRNTDFPPAIKSLKEKYNLNFTQLLQKCCNLSLDEIDGLFCEENFRLITGAKGFAAEEHLNVLFDKNKIPYKQDKAMYSKVDHWVKDNIRVQVKTPHGRANDINHWGFKTHKSHGHGVGELYKINEFDIVALFIGFKIDKNVDKYLPVSVKNEFIFIPASDLEEHPNYPGHLKRVTKIRKDKYKINDLSIFNDFTNIGIEKDRTNFKQEKL